MLAAGLGAGAPIGPSGETWQIDKKIIPGSLSAWENHWEGFEHSSSCTSRMAAHCSLGKVWGPTASSLLVPLSHPTIERSPPSLRPHTTHLHGSQT